MRNSFLILILILPLFSGAGEIILDARMDQVSYTPSTEVGKSSYSSAQLSRMKIDFQGKLGAKNKYRFRLDPLKVDSSTTAKQTTTRDKTSAFIDFAFINRSVTDSFSFSAGKIITGMGGAEGANSPGDLYLRSVAGDEVAGIYWPVGFQGEANCGDHKLRFNWANVTEDLTDSGGNLSASRNLSGVTYTSKLMDGMMFPFLSYHYEDYISGNGTSSVSRKNSYYSIGAKFVVKDFEIEADYLNNKYGRDPQATGNLLDTLSDVGLVRYKFSDSGSVHFKYEATEKMTATGTNSDSKTRYKGQTLAFEYKPVKDENWRAHLAFAQKDTEPETTAAQKEQFVYLGFRILDNILD